MPISTRCVLYTVLGSGYDKVREKIDIDEDATDQEVFDANLALDIHFHLQPHTLGELASLVSIDAVMVFGSLYFIKNIRLLQSLED